MLKWKMVDCCVVMEIDTSRSWKVMEKIFRGKSVGTMVMFNKHILNVLNIV